MSRSTGGKGETYIVMLIFNILVYKLNPGEDGGRGGPRRGATIYMFACVQDSFDT